MRIGNCVFDAGRGTLSRDGGELRPRAKCFSLLAYLVENANRVVSRVEILDVVWSGAAVTDDTLTQTVGDLRRHLGDDVQSILQTVPKRGYRLVLDDKADAGVRTGEIRPADSADALTKIAIAVLPFVNLGGDRTHDAFADGLTDDLITDLSAVSGVTLIGRTSAFAFKDRSRDARAVGRELGVTLIVDGSIRRTIDRVRINVQLVRTSDAFQVWACRFDRRITDLFELQDDVVLQIVGQLRTVISDAAPMPRRRAASLEVYDLLVRGRMSITASPEVTRIAREFLEQAVELDPEFGEARAWLAHAYHFAWLYGGEPASLFRPLSRREGERALQLDPANPDCLWSFGLIRAYGGELDAGAADVEAAVDLNPNHAEAWAFLSNIRVCQGRPLEAIRCVNRALALNPIPPLHYRWFLGFAQYAAGRYEDAIETLSHPTVVFEGCRRIRAAALAQLDRVEEAREVARSFMSDNADFTVAGWAATEPFKSESDRRHFVEGYLKAGLPMS